uniref:Uncharacterized protein n=1 Tax=Minutocellus polymorphus TaxID=265543 RepID=A0A7S0FLI9_9STRA
MVTDKLPESRNITLPRNASGLTIECDFRLEKRRRGLLFFSASVEFQISTESESLTKTIQAKRKRIRRTAHLQTQKYQRFIALRSLPEDATIGILLIKYVVTNLSRRSRIQGRKKQRFFLLQSRLYEGSERIIQNSVLQQARTDGNVFEHNDDGMHLRKSRTVPPL